VRGFVSGDAVRRLTEHIALAGLAADLGFVGVMLRAPGPGSSRDGGKMRLSADGLRVHRQGGEKVGQGIEGGQGGSAVPVDEPAEHDPVDDGHEHPA